mmetsp:Transcript_7644/g.27996  ORF Transcript_7644/g.27996 Transcript_7644/m.27996 type:complete len:333 (-) Transcript_7644:268-1266(-)
MFALCRRRNRGATLTSDRADVPETFSGPAVASARQMVRERFRVAVTLLSGDRLEPLEFAADAPVRDLKAAVKERWGMPVAAQRLVFGTQVIDAEEAEHIGIALLTAVAAEEGEHQELLQNEDAVIELNCVRTTIPEEEQKRLDRALLVASGEGDLACMRLLLSEGASAEGHPPAPTPLLLALAARDEPAAALLRGAGAPVLAAAELRPTASGLANAFVRSDLTEVVHQLASGADPNLRLQRGEGLWDTSSGAPLHACCSLHAKPEAAAVVALLCRLRADLDAKDAEGDSPLSHARYFGAEAIYEVLERQGAKLEGPYYSSLHVAGRRFLGWR